MIQPDRPAVLPGEAGQELTGEDLPAAPLILTLALAEPDQARLNRLRDAYFPPERNFLAAHVTLFHHLPPTDLPAIETALREAAKRPPFEVAVTGLRSLGRGTALTLASTELGALRAGLAQKWASGLTPQDRQGFRPHVTIQNKVTAAEARRLLAELSATFTPFSVRATGLSLWRYRGGPWDEAGRYAFTDRPADPPARRHR